FPVRRVPAIGGEHSIASKNGTQSCRSASMESQIRSPRFVRRTSHRFRCGLWRMSLSCAEKSKLERNWRGLSLQVEHRSFAPFGLRAPKTPLSCWLLTTRSPTAFRLLMQYGTRLTRSPAASYGRSLGYLRKTT